MTILIALNPKRELQDVRIKGWPVVLNETVTIPVSLLFHRDHQWNMTGKHEIHMSHVEWNRLVTDLSAYPSLEHLIETVEVDMKRQGITLNERS